MLDEYMPLKEAAEVIKVGGQPVSSQVLYRWCARGRRGIRLKHATGLNKQYLVREADVLEFIERCGELPPQQYKKKSQKQQPLRRDVNEIQNRLAQRGL